MTITTDDIIAKLKAELAEAHEELAEVTEEATHPPTAELGGGSSGYSTWQTAVVIRGHIEHRIEELSAAVRLAEKGLYGICETCGETIPAERLAALPYTTQCVQCASKMH